MSERDSADPGPALPTREDFDHWHARDAAWAYKKFGGLTVQQAMQVVSEDFGSCVEDFQCMGFRPFCFYFEAFVGYFEEHSFIAMEAGNFACTCMAWADAFAERKSELACARRVQAGVVRVLELLDADKQRLIDDEFDSPEDIAKAREELEEARAAYEKVLAQIESVRRTDSISVDSSRSVVPRSA